MAAPLNSSAADGSPACSAAFPYASRLRLAQQLSNMQGPSLVGIVNLLCRLEPATVQTRRADWSFNLGDLSDATLYKLSDHLLARSDMSAQASISGLGSLYGGATPSRHSLSLDSLAAVGAFSSSPPRRARGGARSTNSASTFANETTLASSFAAAAAKVTPPDERRQAFEGSEVLCSLALAAPCIPPAFEAVAAEAAAASSKPKKGAKPKSKAKPKTKRKRAAPLLPATGNGALKKVRRKKAIVVAGGTKEEQERAAADLPSLVAYALKYGAPRKVDTVDVLEVVGTPAYEKRRLVCGLCQKAFRTNGEIRVHIRVHTGEKPLKCHYCEQRFAHPSNRKSHERSHLGSKPFKCKHPGCGKAFPYATSLKEHSYVHTGERPYKCPICKMGFRSKSNYNKHVKHHAKKLEKELAKAQQLKPGEQQQSPNKSTG